MAHRTVGAGQSVAVSGAGGASDAITVKSNNIRINARGVNAHVAIGTGTTCTQSEYYIADGSASTLALTKASQKVISIESLAGGKTRITCPEGTQMPFTVGNCVSLEVGTADSNWETVITHVGVDSVDQTASFDGFHQTRLVVSADTSGISTDFSDRDATLFNSVKVASVTTGDAGSLFVQQVQITGQA